MNLHMELGSQSNDSCHVAAGKSGLQDEPQFIFCMGAEVSA